MRWLLPFLLFLGIAHKAAACSLCAEYDPLVYATIGLELEGNRVKAMEVAWEFTTTYTYQAIRLYDTDFDGRLDAEETKALDAFFTEELEKNHYYTAIGFNSAPVPVALAQIQKPGFTIEGEQLRYRFTVALDQPLYRKSEMIFGFEDPNGFLAFFFPEENPMTLRGGAGWELADTFKSYRWPVTLTLTPPGAETPPPAEPEKISEPEAAPKPPVREAETSWTGQLGETLAALSLKIGDTLHKVRDGDRIAFLTLMLFSFLYGLVHAAGPGHGKALVSSYFLSGGGSYGKAAGVSLAIGGVHTLSAFVLTALVYYVFQVALAGLVENAGDFTGKISGGIILLIVSYMIARKYLAARKKKRVTGWSAAPHASACGCGACKTGDDVTDLGVVLAAGIIPCPGTVTIFMFTLSLGMVATGLAAALFMSLGMSLIIFLAAILAVGVRKRMENRFRKLALYGEYAGYAVIFILGLTLLAAS